jgi:hypothetical protein
MRRPTLGNHARRAAGRALLLGWLLDARASAATIDLTADLSCRPEAAPGRVLCALRLSPPAGQRLVWADALIVQAPPFARPLRSRVSSERFAAASETERRLALALVASEAGTGTLAVRARVVICRERGDSEVCEPAQREAAAEVRIGR